MIDRNAKLTILHDNNSVFTDHSDNAADYIRDNFSIDLNATEDYLYIGFDRPFGAVYNEIVTPNTNAGDFAAEYWDGDSWESLEITDESKNYIRSGYIFWDRPDDWAQETIDSIEQYYIRIRPSVDHSATSMRGINLVFSDDTALKREFFEIDNSDLLPPGESSHITSHVAARNSIVQRLRNLDYIKFDSNSNRINITQWDLHDIFEVREAATHLALSKIFFNLSDNDEDMWWRKYREYSDKYEEAFRLVRLSIDNNNDGETDSSETLAQKKPFRFLR